MEVSVLPIMNRELTMSSREIASLTGSNHSDVKRSADRLFVAQILTQPLAEFPLNITAINILNIVLIKETLWCW